MYAPVARFSTVQYSLPPNYKMLQHTDWTLRKGKISR